MPEKFSFEQNIPRNALYLVCVPAAFTKARHHSGTFSCTPHAVWCWALIKSKQCSFQISSSDWDIGCWVPQWQKNWQSLPGKVKLDMELPWWPWVNLWAWLQKCPFAVLHWGFGSCFEFIYLEQMRNSVSWWPGASTALHSGFLSRWPHFCPVLFTFPLGILAKIPVA